jgi:CMP-N-acetylneuraminic acid synthetase
MNSDSRVLCLVPARGGSKGVPRKNIRKLGGKPLIAYTIEAALQCADLFCRIIVSTEDEETAAVSREYGAEVPFMRPARLALDTAPTLPVMQHAVQFVEEESGIVLEWVYLLQPTAPFRSPEDIHRAMDIANSTDADSVISVVQVLAEHPVLMKRIEDNRLVPFCVPEPEGTRRQDYEPKAYMRNGAIYISRRDVLMQKNSIRGSSTEPYVMPQERSYSIDSMRDFLLAETVLASSRNLAPES